MNLRLDKLLSELGFGTRREVKKIIKAGRVLIDGIAEYSPEKKVDTEKEEITLDGNKLYHEEFSYYVLHKPAGVITANTDKYHKTVMDLLDIPKKGLFPVGRLDIDTEGLLLITNDGSLGHSLLSPVRHVDKSYLVAAVGKPIRDIAQSFARGIRIDEETITKPAIFQLLGEKEPEEDLEGIQEALHALELSHEEGIELVKDAQERQERLTIAHITIREGKFHQIKRMLQACGLEVIYLKRIAMGALELGKLQIARGEYRKLSAGEVQLLKERSADA